MLDAIIYYPNAKTLSAMLELRLFICKFTDYLIDLRELERLWKTK